MNIYIHTKPDGDVPLSRLALTLREMSTIYNATVQRERNKRETSDSQYSQLKNSNVPLFVSLIFIFLAEEILLKVCFGTHKDNMALLQSIKVESIQLFLPLLSLPPSKDILIVNALEQRAKHS